MATSERGRREAYADKLEEIHAREILSEREIPTSEEEKRDSHEREGSKDIWREQRAQKKKPSS